MKIRLKIVLITSLVGLLVIICASILENNIIISGFINIENSHMVKDVEIVNNALIEKIRSIDALNRDYATWDSSYDAIEEENANYNKEDLSGILSISKLDFVILMRNDGKIVYAKEMFSGEEKDYNASTADSNAQAVYSYFEKNYASVIVDNEISYFNGIIQLPTGLAIISSRPILMTNGTGPVHGTIILGQMISQSFTEKISNQTHLSFSFQPYNSVSYETKLKLNLLFSNYNNINVKNIQNNLISGNSISDIKDILNDSNNSDALVQVISLDEKTISGNVLLRDIFGKPAVLLEVNDTRTIYLEGKDSVKYTFEAVLVVMIIFIIMEYLLFNKFLIKRIISMESQMRTIQNKKMASSRITITGDDELSSFGEAVNSTLDTIEKATEEKQAVFDADSDTYFYVDSSWRIIDYKIIDTLEEIVEKKQLNKKTLFLSDFFNSNIIRKFSKARSESVKTLKPIILDIDLSVNGSLRVFETRIVAVNNNNMMSLVLLRDITDRKKFEQQLLEKNRDLEKFNKFAIDRELRMSDLKKEIRDLKDKKER